jgi:hypothetical protein
MLLSAAGDTDQQSIRWKRRYEKDLNEPTEPEAARFDVICGFDQIQDAGECIWDAGSSRYPTGILKAYIWRDLCKIVH